MNNKNKLAVASGLLVAEMLSGCAEEVARTQDDLRPTEVPAVTAELPNYEKSRLCLAEAALSMVANSPTEIDMSAGGEMELPSQGVSGFIYAEPQQGNLQTVRLDVLKGSDGKKYVMRGDFTVQLNPDESLRDAAHNSLPNFVGGQDRMAVWELNSQAGGVLAENPPAEEICQIAEKFTE